ncbi:MAG TPA: hypothetical protein PKY59_15995 [Pyrinomonadaceae bacterium]|nr:hypothetical protein [Pyrinomonadaceae bacterium]
MNLKQTRLHILHEAENLAPKAKTGVSLHCHTEHSKEMMEFIPHYAEKIPIIAYFWEREQKKYLKREGRAIDFSTAFWSPPMTAKDVHGIETDQINKAGLDAIVSISDHDSIDANLKLNESGQNKKVPISLEWTVPYEYGFFHVGVHNLPEKSAIELTKTLVGYSFGENPTNEKLTELFAMLNEIPEVLVILNHPLWDIERVGQEKHEILLKNFIKEHGRWIHAFEINGFRSWSENKAVLEMAEALGIPVVTGGDRHGCKPNTVLNLSNANTFEEFAEEIRVDKKSEVVLMPEYKQPLQSRQLQSFSEILKFYPEFPEGRKKWFDRVHFDVGDGFGTRPLSVHWDKGGPLWLRMAIKTLAFFGSPQMRPVFRALMDKKDFVPKNAEKAVFEFPDTEDYTPQISTDSVSENYS